MRGRTLLSKRVSPAASHASVQRLVVLLALAAGAVGALGPSRAQAQSSIPREDTWIPDGWVEAIARTADAVYIGGAFTYVGPYGGIGVPSSR